MAIEIENAINEFLVSSFSAQTTERELFEEINGWLGLLEYYLKVERQFPFIRAKINGRLTNSLGKTERRGNQFFVHINQTYLTYHDNNWTVHSTLAHEAIHMIPGCFNHGDAFKSNGRLLEAICPKLRISRCGNDMTYLQQYERISRREEVNKYILKCKKCGHEYGFKRNCKTLQNYTRFRCGKCDGVLELLMPHGGVVPSPTLKITI